MISDSTTDLVVVDSTTFKTQFTTELLISYTGYKEKVLLEINSKILGKLREDMGNEINLVMDDSNLEMVWTRVHEIYKNAFQSVEESFQESVSGSDLTSMEIERILTELTDESRVTFYTLLKFVRYSFHYKKMK